MLNKNIFIAVAVLFMSACSTTGVEDTRLLPDPLLVSVQKGADDLVEQLSRHHLVTPVIVASAQNNDHLSQVCAQGRLISDIVSSRLTQSGYSVAEVRLTQMLSINKEGETILSRELDNLAKSAKVETVVTATWSTIGADQAGQSTYSVKQQLRDKVKTYVTLKAVRISDGLVLSSKTFVSPSSWNC